MVLAPPALEIKVILAFDFFLSGSIICGMKEISGGITAPAGFKASGIHCGIKKRGKDLALICSDMPAAAAAVFTTNRVQAAPVKLSSEHLKNGKARAVVVNSGNANACTAARGYKDAKVMAELAADELGIDLGDVLVASTGIIGKFMPVDKIAAGVKSLVRKLEDSENISAAQAIITTDSFLKEKAVRFSVDGVDITIGAMGKGSGMIFPHMATMLCFITTDALISKSALDTALKNSVEMSFHRITVDGDRSTNDSVFILANGAAGNRKIQTGTKAFNEFQEALDSVTSSIAKMIVRDGEGAAKFIEVEVIAGRTVEDAKRIGFSIANSNLVKTAFAGKSPNWGRIASAAGNAGVNINESKLSISIGGVQVMKNGCAVKYNAESAKKALADREIKVVVNLEAGNKGCTVWTCDLTEDYVRINTGYS